MKKIYYSLIIVFLTLLLSSNQMVSYAQKTTSSNTNSGKVYLGNFKNPMQKGYNGIPVWLIAARLYYFVDGNAGYHEFFGIWEINTYTGGVGTCINFVINDLNKVSYCKKNGLIYIWEGKKPVDEEGYLDILKTENGNLYSTKDCFRYYPVNHTIIPKKQGLQMKMLEDSYLNKLLRIESYKQCQDEEGKQNRKQDSKDTNVLFRDYSKFKELFNTESEYQQCIAKGNRDDELKSIINEMMERISQVIVYGYELRSPDMEKERKELLFLCDVSKWSGDNDNPNISNIRHYIKEKLKDFVETRKDLDREYIQETSSSGSISYNKFLENYIKDLTTDY